MVDFPNQPPPLAYVPNAPVIGNRPDVQKTVSDFIAHSAAPFGLLGKVMTGKSEAPMQDATMAAMGLLVPPGLKGAGAVEGMASRELPKAAKLAQFKLENALLGVELGGHPVERMDLALNPKLIELMPRHVQEMAEHHNALNGEIGKRVTKIDAAVTAAGHEPMDLALSSDLLAQAPAKVRKLMAERGVLVKD